MKKSIVFSMLIMALTVIAQSKGTVNNTKPSHFMKVKVDKIDNSNSDCVSRVRCTLTGIPHTSSRIDSVTATVGGQILKATDIDGVDFGRYFQWEDEGAVHVDVDLNLTRSFTTLDTIRFHTIHGVYSVPFKTVSSENKR